MDATDTKRRLLWHGFFIFLVSLLGGIFIPVFTNPRMGVSAHLAGITGGLFVIALGAVWDEIALSPGRAAAVFWTALSNYLGWVALIAAAVLGASQGMPVAGAGFSAAPWQEALVFVGLAVFSVAITVCCVLVLLGLSRRAS